MFFFFNDTATTEIYTLSLHDALPIFSVVGGPRPPHASHARREPPDGAGVPGRGLFQDDVVPTAQRPADPQDRKSTRLNSSHANISYAVFCLKKNNAHIIRLAQLKAL